MTKKEKPKPRNSVLAGIIQQGADWFFRRRVVAPKRGRGRKERPRNSNRTRKEDGE